jgi:hypothetical protein
MRLQYISGSTKWECKGHSYKRKKQSYPKRSGHNHHNVKKKKYNAQELSTRERASMIQIPPSNEGERESSFEVERETLLPSKVEGKKLCIENFVKKLCIDLETSCMKLQAPKH